MLHPFSVGREMSTCRALPVTLQEIITYTQKNRNIIKASAQTHCGVWSSATFNQQLSFCFIK